MLSSICVQRMKEQEKLLAQRKVPGLQSQLEEYKSALCQLQAQKQRLQTKVGHTVTMTTRGLITGGSAFLFISTSQYLLNDIIKICLKGTKYIGSLVKTDKTRISTNVYTHHSCILIQIKRVHNTQVLSWMVMQLWLCMQFSWLIDKKVPLSVSWLIDSVN